MEPEKMDAKSHFLVLGKMLENDYLHDKPIGNWKVNVNCGWGKLLLRSDYLLKILTN